MSGSKHAVGEHVLSSSLSSSFLPSPLRSGAVLSCAVAAILLSPQAQLRIETCDLLAQLKHPVLLNSASDGQSRQHTAEQ